MFRKGFITLLLVSAIILSLSLTGCQDNSGSTTGQKDTSGNTTDQEDTSGSISQNSAEKEVTLRFPHWFYSHGGTFDKWIISAQEQYEKDHPNVKIDGYAVGYEEFWDKIDTAIAGGNPPDILALTNSNLGKYIDVGSIAPLDDLIDMDDIKNNWTPLQQEGVPACAPDGKTYLLINDMGFYLPMYRPSVFEKAGIEKYATTPEEFIEMTKSLTDVEGVTGYAAMINPGNFGEGIYDLSIWIIGLGGHYGADAKPTLNSPEVIEAMTYLKTLYDAGVMVKETDKGTYRKMLATGNVGTIIDGPWMYGMSVEWDPTVVGDYEVAPLPFPTQNAAAFFEGLSISSKSKNQKEAIDFIEYLCTQEQQKKLVDITGILSARSDLFTDKEFESNLYEKWPWMKQYSDHLSSAVLLNPKGIGGNTLVEIQKILYTAFERILYENEDPTKALNDAQEEALGLF